MEKYWRDPGDKTGKHYTVSFVAAYPYYQQSFCHLKIDTSYVNPNPGMYLKKVLVDTL